MKRRIGTALSVLGLLAVGTAAAAVNVRMLHSAGTESAQFQMSTTSEVPPLASSSSASAGTETVTLGAPGGLPGTPGGTAKPRPNGTSALGSVGAVGGAGGFEADDDHARGDDGEDHEDRPQLTEAQMTLLRVSAMVRTEPQTVRAVARGENTDATLLAAVKQAAAAVGTTLQDLAAVENLPPARDRGHGGRGEHHGDDRFGVDTSTATLNTYDD